MTEPGGMIETVEIAVPGGSLRAPLARPARDSGPGVVVLGDPALPDGYAASVAGALGAEGHVALALTPASGVAPAAAAARLGAAIEGLRALPGCIGRIGAVGFGAGASLALAAAREARVDCAVAYGVDGPPDPAGAPVAIHRAVAAVAMRATAPDPVRGDHAVFDYAGLAPGFAIPGAPGFDRHHAGLAWSRTIAHLKRTMGPHFDLEELWEYHLACEFQARDAAATMRTTVAEPYVNHVPTLTGGVGHDLLKRFYAHHFVGQVPRDRRSIPISRTIGADRIVDEKIFCFTHDAPIDWLLPGVAPTGRYVEIPIVAIVTFRGEALVNEHIYWDQASVLVQIGLLDPAGLPVAGRDQARELLDPTLPSNALMPAWASSAAKPA